MLRGPFADAELLVCTVGLSLSN